jgi:hypothetical protein
MLPWTVADVANLSTINADPRQGMCGDLVGLVGFGFRWVQPVHYHVSRSCM